MLLYCLQLCIYYTRGIIELLLLFFYYYYYCCSLNTDNVSVHIVTYNTKESHGRHVSNYWFRNSVRYIISTHIYDVVIIKFLCSNSLKVINVKLRAASN